MSRRSEQRNKRRQEQFDNDIRWLMGDARGRRIVQSWIDDAGINTVSPFTGNSATFYKIGQQDFVRGFVNHCRRVALQDVRRMEDEAAAATQSAQLEDAQAVDDPPDA